MAVIGASLIVAGSRKTVSPEVRLLAQGSAAGLTPIDVIYGASGRISPVYLLDAVGEWRFYGCGSRRGAEGAAA